MGAGNGAVALEMAAEAARGGVDGVVGPAVPGLAVSGLVVAKADLVAVLRAWVPGLSEIAVSEDGEQFLLLFGGAEGGE